MDHKILLRQLGGNKFCTMTGAKNFVGGKNDLTFRIGGGARQRINIIRIILEPSDTYTMEFYRLRAGERNLIETVRDVYCEDLQSVFTRVTGMDTHL